MRLFIDPNWFLFHSIGNSWTICRIKRQFHITANPWMSSILFRLGNVNNSD